jgi:hypothetical protein
MSKKQNNPQKLGKVYKFLERFWLIVAVVSVFLTIYIVAEQGFENSKLYFILPIIAIVIWMMRRRLRKSYQRMMEAQENEQQPGT